MLPTIHPEVFHQHQTLTSASQLLLMDTLQRHGNRLSLDHKAAVRQLCATLTDFATGQLTGRKVFALSTGLGKTSAIIAWVTALHRLGAPAGHISVAVSASKVEALCNIKRALLDGGVPEEAIGLRHSLGAAASLPSTGDDDRRFMLVTHQRVRGGRNHALFTQHLGEPRSVMIYDEALFRSDSIAISERFARVQLAATEEDLRGRDAGYEGALGYLRACRELIVASVAQSKAQPAEPLSITLPALGEVERAGYASLLDKYGKADLLRELVTLSGETLRVATIAQDEGVLWHRVTVPQELDRVLVLDASYPIRQLCKLDETLQPASRLSDVRVKSFDNVTVHQLRAYGGRHSVEDAFREQRREKRAVSREVVEVVKGIPADESVLIFTFKKRAVDISRILLDDLADAGVDVKAELPGKRRRINVLTWGDETSLNEYAHCENVILAGVLHRSLLDLAAAAVGQLDDRDADLGTKRLKDLLESEIAHSVFQAISRGKCREIDLGQAKPMKAWLIHPRPLQQLLDPVLPGAKWVPWIPVHKGVLGDGEVARMAVKVLDHLKGLPESVRKVSSRAVKEALKIAPEQESAFTRAVGRLDDLSAEWVRKGRSLVRSVDTFGFTPEAT
jgi:hypothetical protein